jgi:methylated-DNA-[protein]-cysteine S-methyltransferase
MTTPPAIVGTIPAPFGPYTAAFTARGLAKLAFADEQPDACRAFLHRWEPAEPVAEGLGRDDDPRLAQLSDELNAYFAGDLRTFRTRLAPRGTPFQRLVYHALLGIPFGETRSYRELAVAIGRARAIRAVGAANGANPIAILVPCHRLIGSDGSLTGYGGGLDLKARLLAIEGVTIG